MRCSVCGKNERFHKFYAWALFKNGIQVTSELRYVSKCRAIQVFQSMLISRVGELRKVKV